MKMKLFHWMLLGAMTCGLSLPFAACSDDDDDEKSNEESQAEKQAMDPYEKNTAEGIALYNILGQLAGTDSLPDNWKTATFEPIVGAVLDESTPFVRTIIVNSVNEAAKMYQSLTATTLKEGATTANWQKDGVGTLTYEAQNQSNLFATIDVNVKQLPKLTQLRFVPEDAIGANGFLGFGNADFEGDPYYHIGDVVKDKDGRYWICVRSAWNGKKGDTHWASFQLLTKKSTKGTGFAANMTTFKATKERGVHVVPTNLGSSPEKLGYLAQLLAVLTTSDQTELNSYFADGGPLEDGLGDLGFDAHTMMYSTSLGNAWDIHNVWSKILPGYIDEEGVMHRGDITKDYFSADEYGSVNFFYSGYSSPMWTSNMELYVCENSSDAFSKQELTTWEWNMDSQADGSNNRFDIRDFIENGCSGDRTNINISLQGGKAGVNGRILPVVYTTGKGLTKTFTEPDPTKKFETCEDVFLGSRDLSSQDLSKPHPQVGYVLGVNCKFYENAADARKSGVEPAGLVVVMDKNNVVETGTTYNGLAMAMHDLNGLFTWSDDLYTFGTCSQSNPNYLEIDNFNSFNGLTKTQELAAGDCASNAHHEHRAAKAALEYQKQLKMSAITMNRSQLSNWFLPSDGQWALALETLTTGLFKEGKFEFSVLDLNQHFVPQGVDTPSGCYWTSTTFEGDATCAETLSFEFEYPQFFTVSKDNEKTARHKVRPFIAFTAQ